MGRWLLAVLLSCSDDGVGVYNTPPSAALTSPPDGSAHDEGIVVTFDGLVDDSQDDPGALVVTLQSDKDGTLAKNLVPDDLGRLSYSTANLSPGNHAITLTAIDTQGEHNEDVIGITINDLPDNPTIAIASPVPGQFGKEGQPWDFRALVSDEQDTADQIEVTVASDVDGPFCDVFADITGVAECVASLSGGTHFLTFTAIDTDGLESEATVYFDVLGLEDQDHDHDGWSIATGDCNDEDPSVHPGAAEYANGADDDCDGTIDEGTSEYDDDGDGQTEAEGDCDDGDADTWRAAVENDCDDTTVAVSPTATESCNGIDDDCDGSEDESDAVDASTWYDDDDGDSYGDPLDTTDACTAPAGYVDNHDDCDDGDDEISPARTEICDTVDNDCDGGIDEDLRVVYYEDAEGDRFGDATVWTPACSTPDGYRDLDTGGDDVAPGT